MQTAAIICEYNPFHLGHQIQLNQIRSELADEEVCIIALMSGCFVQRGGPSVLLPGSRAEAALAAGVDLVLELPFPWSMSGADYFAGAALSILERLGGIDWLCFGSECGDLRRLEAESRRITDAAFQTALDKIAISEPSLSWAKMREAAYRAVYREEPVRYSANDLLGIAYLSHLKNIHPWLIRRHPGFSASSAREAYEAEDWKALSALVPKSILTALRGYVPQSNAADKAVLAALRLTSVDEMTSYAECTAELAGLIGKHVPECGSTEELLSACCNKKYTAARVRRVIWHIFLRTPSSAMTKRPAYTRLLACNERGRAWLNARRKHTAIPVITRASNVRMDFEVEKQYLFAMKRNYLGAFLMDQEEKKLPIVK